MCCLFISSECKKTRETRQVLDEDTLDRGNECRCSLFKDRTQTKVYRMEMI